MVSTTLRITFRLRKNPEPSVANELHERSRKLTFATIHILRDSCFVHWNTITRTVVVFEGVSIQDGVEYTYSNVTVIAKLHVINNLNSTP